MLKAAIVTEDSRHEAKRRADTYYAGLRRLVRKYKPAEFGRAVASIIYRVLHDRSLWPYYPLHHLVHSIEANCAYYQTHITTRDVTLTRVNQIMNYYKDYYDPYLEYALEQLQDIRYTVLAIARQQFAYQRDPRGTALGRSRFLFLQDEPLPKTARLFVSEYGFTMHDWVYMSFAVWAYTGARNSPTTSATNYINSEISSMPKGAVRPFLDMSSLSPTEISAFYHSIREQYPSYLHIFLPSVFLEHPLINYGHDTYLAVHPSLIFYHAVDGLYRACQKLDEQVFHREFAQSFERYVGAILNQLEGDYQVFTESEIQNVSPGRSCDYAVDDGHSIILVECKSVRYSATLLTENAIRGDNSTTKLAESFEQIQETADRIRAGKLDALFDSQGKRLLGLTVTFGRIYFANSPNYIKEFITPRMDLSAQARWPYPLDEEPQVVCVDTLEDIIAVLNETDISVTALIEAKLSEEYGVVGEWDSYLAIAYGDQGVDWDLPLLKNTVEAWFAELSDE